MLYISVIKAVFSASLLHSLQCHMIFRSLNADLLLKKINIENSCDASYFSVNRDAFYLDYLKLEKNYIYFL